MPADNGGPIQVEPRAGWKRSWLVDFVQAVVIALALFMAIVLGLLFLYNSTPHGELGSPPSVPVPAPTSR